MIVTLELPDSFAHYVERKTPAELSYLLQTALLNPDLSSSIHRNSAEIAVIVDMLYEFRGTLTEINRRIYESTITRAPSSTVEMIPSDSISDEAAAQLAALAQHSDEDQDVPDEDLDMDFGALRDFLSDL